MLLHKQSAAPAAACGPRAAICSSVRTGAAARRALPRSAAGATACARASAPDTRACTCHGVPAAAAVAPRARRAPRHGAALAAGAGAAQPSAALIFDCDGVIVETEELHRRAYNGAFEAFGITVGGAPCEWPTKYYDLLQNTVAGGKGKMKYHFGNAAWDVATREGPVAEAGRDALVDALQDKKTEIYKRIVEEMAEARPGVLALMDEAASRPDVALAICSAATKAGFEKVVNSVVGPDRLARFDLILAGDDVANKKPHPEIYDTARARLGVEPARCLVIEDSMVGLRAARGAGMQCLITPTSSTDDQPFCEEGAAAVVSALGGETYRVGIDDLFAPCPNGTGTVVNLSGMAKMAGNECVVKFGDAPALAQSGAAA